VTLLLVRDDLIKDFQKRVIAWFRQNGRTFYWRTHVLDGWQWLVLELLLKKTKAETVEKRFPSIILKYSRPEVVVQSSNNELENDLKHLGLQRQRRIALKLIAQSILTTYNGRIPSDEVSLLSVPHVGPYIANAVLCFGYGKRRPIVDINVARVLTRFFGMKMPKDAREEWLWELAENTLPQKNWREYNYGLIDIGATLCRKDTQRCSQCYLREKCSARERLIYADR
jgi:A/G-specific adenine glycosylase